MPPQVGGGLCAHLAAQQRRPPEKEARCAKRLPRPAPEPEPVDVPRDAAIRGKPESRVDAVVHVTAGRAEAVPGFPVRAPRRPGGLHLVDGEPPVVRTLRPRRVAQHAPHRDDFGAAVQAEHLVVERGVLGIAGGHALRVQPPESGVQRVDCLPGFHQRGSARKSASSRLKPCRTVASRTAGRSPSKCISSLDRRPATEKPNHTVPTGFSGLPPLGPATPVTATLTCACEWRSAPNAIARATTSLTAPCESMAAGSTCSSSLLASLE